MPTHKAKAMAERVLQNVAWHTRFGYPYQTVNCAGVDYIGLGFFFERGKQGIGIKISRKDARLLAKRIEQCLKGTPMKRRDAAGERNAP